jgi:plasminogen activator
MSCFLNVSVFVVVFALLSGGAVGQVADVVADQTSEVEMQGGGVTFSVRAQIGHISGEANEWVYDGGYVLSQLIWEIESLTMIGVGATVELNKWFTLQGDLWGMAADGSGTMDDYDWMVPGTDWTHWSHHEDVDVTQGRIVDLSVEVFPFRGLDDHPVSVCGVLGHRMENYEWEARGGSYVYSDSGFRDSSGSFTDGELGITYEQKLHVTYVGVVASYQWENFDFGFRLIGSPFVYGDADDRHHMRDLEMHASLENGDMYSVGLSLSYHLSEFFKDRQIVLSGSVVYTEYDTITADSTYTWNDEGSTTESTYNDAEGSDLETTMASLALSVTF